MGALTSKYQPFFEVSVDIDTPVEFAWEYLMDNRNGHEWSCFFQEIVSIPPRNPQESQEQEALMRRLIQKMLAEGETNRKKSAASTKTKSKQTPLQQKDRQPSQEQEQEHEQEHEQEQGQGHGEKRKEKISLKAKLFGLGSSKRTSGSSGTSVDEDIAEDDDSQGGGDDDDDDDDVVVAEDNSDDIDDDDDDDDDVTIDDENDPDMTDTADTSFENALANGRMVPLRTNNASLVSPAASPASSPVSSPPIPIPLAVPDTMRPSRSVPYLPYVGGSPPAVVPPAKAAPAPGVGRSSLTLQSPTMKKATSQMMPPMSETDSLGTRSSLTVPTSLSTGSSMADLSATATATATATGAQPRKVPRYKKFFNNTSIPAPLSLSQSSSFSASSPALDAIPATPISPTLSSSGFRKSFTKLFSGLNKSSSFSTSLDSPEETDGEPRWGSFSKTMKKSWRESFPATETELSPRCDYVGARRRCYRRARNADGLGKGLYWDEETIAIIPYKLRREYTYNMSNLAFMYSTPLPLEAYSCMHFEKLGEEKTRYTFVLKIVSLSAKFFKKAMETLGAFEFLEESLRADSNNMKAAIEARYKSIPYVRPYPYKLSSPFDRFDEPLSPPIYFGPRKNGRLDGKHVERQIKIYRRHKRHTYKIWFEYNASGVEKDEGKPRKSTEKRMAKSKSLDLNTLSVQRAVQSAV